MSHLYIHIPFCRQACYYCNFHFSTQLRYMTPLVEAIAQEMAARSKACPYAIETVYLGGGTPSLLSEAQGALLFQCIGRYYKVAPGAELTIEANPEDLSAEKIALWRSWGINRVSIGIQSFSESDLRYMNRSHNAAQSLAALDLLAASGLRLSADIILGIPGSDRQRTERDLRLLTDRGVGHISCYLLTVEPKTVLQWRMAKKVIAPVDAQRQTADFMQAAAFLAAAGYEHYELSNYARKGQRSRHNSAYWSGAPYMGFGPGAHSFDGEKRRCNVANNALYLKKIHEGGDYFEEECLDETMRYNEFILTKIRLKEGIALSELEEKYTEPYISHFYRQLEKIKKEYYSLKNNTFVLNRQGWLWADAISVDLFV